MKLSIWEMIKTVKKKPVQHLTNKWMSKLIRWIKIWLRLSYKNPNLIPMSDKGVSKYSVVFITKIHTNKKNRKKYNSINKIMKISSKYLNN